MRGIVAQSRFGIQRIVQRDVAIHEHPFPRNEDIVEDQGERETLERERTIRSRFNFSMVGIPHGSTLSFYNDESITATVVDDRTIEFEGEVQSLTKAARTILLRENPNRNPAIPGPRYWVFEGESVTARRLRMETE